MEDGGSPYYIGFGVLLLLVVLHAIFYGFLAALENQNENSLEKLAKEENQKAYCCFACQMNRQAAYI